jgi:hypothetical protein
MRRYLLYSSIPDRFKIEKNQSIICVKNPAEHGIEGRSGGDAWEGAMVAVASGRGHNAAGRMLETSFAGVVPPRSVGAAIKHAMVIGAAAAVLQLLLLLALLYACGVIAS